MLKKGKNRKKLPKTLVETGKLVKGKAISVTQSRKYGQNNFSYLVREESFH